MRQFLPFFFILLLTVGALARSPVEVVANLYNTHLETQDMRKTVKAVPKCFTPGFLGIIQRALQGEPPKPFVDIDIFGNNQMGLGDFQPGQAKITGKDALVPLSLWVSRTKKFSSPSQRKGAFLIKAIIYLTDVGDGDGFQIRDIEFLPTKDNPKPFRIREWLVPIAEGRDR